MNLTAANVMGRSVAAISLLVAASACESAPPRSSASVSLYQLAGSKQCERATRTLDTLKQELAAAGVDVQAAWCGHDGRMYAQTCGNPDGRILVVQVRADQAPAAERLGLKPLGEFPESVAAACR